MKTWPLRTESARSAIDGFAMGHADNQDENLLFDKFVDYPVVSNPDAAQAGEVAFQGYACDLVIR